MPCHTVSPRRRQLGLSLVEILIVALIAGMILAALSGVVTGALQSQEIVQERNQLTQQANFAMQRMVRAVRGTDRLLLPLVDNPLTTLYSESLRNPGVLAVALDPTQDLDADGFADADNDRDGKVDEDLPADAQNDGKPGIIGIDDNNVGITDISLAGNSDDDESGLFTNEDPIDGIDNDNDGSIDEDAGADNNGDGCPGVCGVDDDVDGSTDEGNVNDDDEDGSVDEDWIDPVVFYLSGSKLVERLPDLKPTSGTDYTERTIADNVSQFVVERLPTSTGARAVLIEISLQLTGAGGEVVNVKTRGRVSGAR